MKPASVVRLVPNGGVLFVCTALALLALGPASTQAAQIEWQQGLGLTKSAQLTAHINPEGVDTTCHAQYATQYAYEHEGGWTAAVTAPCTPEDLGTGTIGTSAGVQLEGLSLNTVYDYRFVTTGGGHTVTGAAETFTTFGVQSFSMASVDSKAKPYSQAGGHPYELITQIVLKSNYLHSGAANGNGELKDVRVALPSGLVGSAAATEPCPQRLEETSSCPRDSQVGTIGVRLIGDARNGRTEAEEEPTPKPLFNLVPPKGVAARFGTLVNVGASAFIDASVRSGGDYGVNADSLNITSFAQPKRVIVTMWGYPASRSHDSERTCTGNDYELGCSYEGKGRPFLSNPTSCAGPLSVTGSIDSYQEPGELVSMSAGLPAIVGCKEVPFAPSIRARPTTSTTDSPTGLSVDLHVPQNETEGAIASSDLKGATVTFPAGMAVDPSSADGLESCSEAQVGFTGFKELNAVSEPGVQTAQFTPGAAQCPDGAKLGSVEIVTPLLDHPLTGAMYLAAPHQNPFGSLIAVYLTVYDPITGVVVKLPGKVETDPRTGQITTTFDQNPQLPFEDLKVSLFGAGEDPAHSRASLTTPQTCGSFTTSSLLVPWSGNPPSRRSDSFDLTARPEGGSCPGSEAQAPNAPGFTAGTTSPVAGTFSPFVLKLAREDGSQRFSALNVTLPPGLLGKIAGLQQCPQSGIETAQHRNSEGQGAQEAAHPSCPTASEVGVVHVGAGSGAPFYVTGHAYFAGPYNGAPFSLAILTPALAGPFDLGTVVVRAGLFIDPHTAQVTVKSDPFPTILDGIPLDIRNIAVEINRADFTLNPTSCDPMTVTGQETSTAGQTAALSDRFQAGGCTNLPFKPLFTASTNGITSRKDGASLTVNVGSGPGQANIARVDVSLPKQLPARNDTLKLACPEATFAANPAACPEGSRVGAATAVTPLLASPLTGPAYLVSHGGAAFPDLEVVLQGEGITLILDGKTNIDPKTGITSSSFDTVPDAPISTFQLSLPEGPHSILGAPEGKFCSLTRTVTVKKKVLVKVKRKSGGKGRKHGPLKRRRVTRKVKKRVPASLAMPTRIVAQNGAVIDQGTVIAVTGCPKAVVKKHKARKARKKTKKGHAKRNRRGSKK